MELQCCYKLSKKSIDVDAIHENKKSVVAPRKRIYVLVGFAIFFRDDVYIHNEKKIFITL